MTGERGTDWEGEGGSHVDIQEEGCSCEVTQGQTLSWEHAGLSELQQWGQGIAVGEARGRVVIKKIKKEKMKNHVKTLALLSHCKDAGFYSKDNGKL